MERLAQIHIPAKFSHTKGPAREKRKDESSSRQDFKGRAAAPGPAQAPPSAYIRRGSRAGGLSALPPCAGPCPEGGWRGSCGGAGPKGRDTASAPPPPPAARGPSSAKLKRLRKVFRKERKDCHVQPTRRAVLWPVHLFQLPLHSILGIPLPNETPAPLRGCPVPAGCCWGSCRGPQPPGPSPRPSFLSALSQLDSPSGRPRDVSRGPWVGRGSTGRAQRCWDGTGPSLTDRGRTRPLDGRACGSAPETRGRRALPAPARAREQPREGRSSGRGPWAWAAPARQLRPRGSPVSAGSRIWKRHFYGPTSSLLPGRAG